jgi:hypothetical protein
VKHQIFNIVSMLDMAGERTTEVDRFSTLPDDILTHIMKFMVTKEAVQTGILVQEMEACLDNSCKLDSEQ